MREPSRRDFVKTCACLAVTGCASSLGLSCAQADRGKDALPVSEPGYLALHRKGELKERADALWALMKSCTLCPRQCGVNRLAGDKGFCRASAQLEIASYNPHFGEEQALVGHGGSGTIFLTHCGLRCVFCINWEVSQQGGGEPRSVEDMAGMMLNLRQRGCHNINVVTPTHYAPHILRALDSAAGQGLSLPLVYNTCGWERQEILRQLDGVVDIYLPDFKYADGKAAAKYSSAAGDYPEVTRQALLEMHRQVGTAQPGPDGIMRRGLMIRHLVMPNNVAASCAVVNWIGDHLPRDTYLNIMSQYTPTYKAHQYPAIARRITREEYAEVVQCARAKGLTNLDIQGYPGTLF